MCKYHPILTYKTLLQIHLATAPYQFKHILNASNEMAHNPLTSGRNRFVYCCMMKCADDSSYIAATKKLPKRKFKF